MSDVASNRELAPAALQHWFQHANSLHIEPSTSHRGLSGAMIWKVVDRQDAYCLRRWPERRPARQKLLAIHGFLGHLQQFHPQIIPRPLSTRHGESLANHDGELWELTSWMPGAACRDTRFPPQRLRAALQTLARLHNAAAGFPSKDAATSCGTSPGLTSRWEIAQGLLEGEFASLDRAINTAPANSAVAAIRSTFDRLPAALANIADELEAAARLQLPLQWRLGDVHREHVLFVGDEVSGVLDFAAAGVDSPVGDVARLLGSIAGDDVTDWRDGLSAYEEIRPLTEDERRALAAFDAGGLCAAVANWARWLAVDRRAVPASIAIASRLHGFAGRLDALNSRRRASVIDEERH